MLKPSPTSRGRRIRLAAASLALLGTGGYGAYYYATHQTRPEGCTVEAGGNRLVLEPQQAANASTIAAVASSRRLPEQALTIALATAMQESALRNLDHGDRDSVGLFQQRPSQGWGTVEQIMDPVYSTNEFFDGLVKIPDYSRLPLTVAAQEVQRSGYPEAYAKHESAAALLASALTGRLQGALSCVLEAAGDGEAAADDPKTGGPKAVRERLVREFGDQVAPVEPSAPTTPAAPSEGGRTVTVPPPPDTADEPDGADRRGWELAQWAVAHARELRIERVVYGDWSWSVGESAEGWRRGTAEDPAGVPGAADGAVRITVAP